MKTAHENGTAPREKVDALEVEVQTIQGTLGDLVTELDHRRRTMFDVRLQLRRHPVVLGLLAAGVLAAVGGTIALIVRSRRRRRTLAARWGRLRMAVARMGAHPERVASRPPGVGRKIAASGGSAMASVLGRRVAKQLFGAG